MLRLKYYVGILFRRTKTNPTFLSSRALTCSATNDDDDDDGKFNSFKEVDLLYSLRNEPAVALSYFHQLTNKGFEHDVSTYAALVKILCIWDLHMDLVSVFLDIIDRNTVEISDLLDALTEEQHHPSTPSIKVAHDALVKSYVSVGMFDKAFDVMFLVRRKGFLPRIKTCNFFMDSLIKHGKVDFSLALYKQLKNLGLEPNICTYTIFVKALFKKRSVYDARDVLKEMEDARVRLDPTFCSTFIEGLCANQKSGLGYQILQKWRENIDIPIYAYTVVIHGFCQEMKFDSAENVLHDMEKQRLYPDIHCYDALINSYCKAGKVNEVVAFHDKMLSKGVKTNCVIVSRILQCMSGLGKNREAVKMFNECKSRGIVIDEILYNIAMGALCNIGKVEEALGLLNDMIAKEMNLDVMHFTTLINGYCLKGEVFCAQELLENMEKIKLEPDIITYNILARGFSRNGDASKVRDLLKERGLKPNEDTHNMIIEGLCVGGNMKEAQKYLDSLEQKSCDNYAALLDGYCQANRCEEAYAYFHRLVKQRILVKISSCYNLLHNLCGIGANDKAFKLFYKMLDLNMEPSKMMYNKLISTFCEDGDIERARHVFDNLLQRGTPDVFAYTIMIQGYCKKNFFQEANNLFQEMKMSDVKPDIVTYTVLLVFLSKKMQSRGCSLTGASGNKEETFYDAIGLYEEIVDRGLEPDVKCYTVLIDVFYKMGNLDKANGLCNEMVYRGLEPDMECYTVLIDMFCMMGNLNIAIGLFNKMVYRGLEPDVKCYTVLIDVFCKMGNLDKANGLCNEMVYRGLEPDVKCYTVLIDMFCMMGNLNIAIGLFDEIIVRGLKPDIAAYNTVALGCINMGDMDKAKSLRDEMNSKGMQTYTLNNSIRKAMNEQSCD